MSVEVDLARYNALSNTAFVNALAFDMNVQLSTSERAAFVALLDNETNPRSGRAKVAEKTAAMKERK